MSHLCLNTRPDPDYDLELEEAPILVPGLWFRCGGIGGSAAPVGEAEEGGEFLRTVQDFASEPTATATERNRAKADEARSTNRRPAIALSHPPVRAVFPRAILPRFRA